MEIKTKANVGQKVWFLFDRKVSSAEVKKIKMTIEKEYALEGDKRVCQDISYDVGGIELREDEIFNSRQELANAVLDGRL